MPRPCACCGLRNAATSTDRSSTDQFCIDCKDRNPIHAVSFAQCLGCNKCVRESVFIYHARMCVHARHLNALNQELSKPPRYEDGTVCTTGVRCGCCKKLVAVSCFKQDAVTCNACIQSKLCLRRKRLANAGVPGPMEVPQTLHTLHKPEPSSQVMSHPMPSRPPPYMRDHVHVSGAHGEEAMARLAVMAAAAVDAAVADIEALIASTSTTATDTFTFTPPPVTHVTFGVWPLVVEGAGARCKRARIG
jgi:hypothetical protein